MADSRWWEAEHWSAAVAPYVVLMDAFIDGRLRGAEFELLYLRLFKSDEKLTNGDPAFGILERLFTDVDEFCDDPVLRHRTRGIDEADLRHRAASARDKLKQARR